MMGVGLGDGMDVDNEYREAGGYVSVRESDANDVGRVGVDGRPRYRQ